jgi:hypothetical protein
MFNPGGHRANFVLRAKLFTGIRTQDFALAMQALYCLSQASSPFYLAYFGHRVLLFAQASLDCNPSIYVSCHSWNDRSTTVPSYWLTWGGFKTFNTWAFEWHSRPKQYQKPVTHACNPSYSGGRDQEDGGWKPVPGIVPVTLSWKKRTQSQAGRVVQGVGPEFKLQYQKKKIVNE